MIFPELVLDEIFQQLPMVSDKNGKQFKPVFSGGSQDALNLFLANKKGVNKYPLIWLVEGKGANEEKLARNYIDRNIRLVIARESVHKMNTNKIIWETEFKEMLNPLLKNVLLALEKSGVTQIVDGVYKTERLTNYTDNVAKSKSATFDIWNVIVLDAKIRFEEKADGTPNCIKQIKF